MLVFWSFIIVMILVALSFVLVPCITSPQHIFKIPHNYILIFLLLLTIPILALSSYWRWGASQELSQWMVVKQQTVAAEKLRLELGSPENVIAKLKQHLAQDPKSAQGWYLLGKLALSINELTEATHAFANAYQLEPNNLGYELRYIESLILTQQTTQAEALLSVVFKQQPKNAQVLNLLAFNAFQQHNYQKAMTLWQQLLVAYPLNEEDREAITKAINQAKQAATMS